MLIKVVALVAGVLFYAALGYGLYLLSGKRSMPFLWAVLISQTMIGIIGSLMLPSELIAERMKPKGKDRDPLATLFLSIFCLAQLVIAVLDLSKWHLTDNIPMPLQCIALAIQSLGWVGLYWAMYVNNFFSSAIRMQPDRGQKVITEGPYHWIRHPGYAFASLAFVFESIAIGSWLSIIPAFMMVGYMGYRTLLEEKMLSEELEGYTEYSAKVRYRWIPGVW